MNAEKPDLHVGGRAFLSGAPEDFQATKQEGAAYFMSTIFLAKEWPSVSRRYM